jgi:hypothetical protein
MYLTVPPLVVATGGLLTGSHAAWANPAAPAAKWLPESDPTGKALGYVADATKATRPDKAGVMGKDQFCNNCQLYTKGDAIDGQEAGKCLMLPAGAVHGKGWCKSWVKKA